MYSIIRTVILIILLIIVIKLIRKYTNKRKKTFFLFILSYICIGFILFSMPVENLFVTFDSPEAVYKYQHLKPEGTVINVVEGKNVDYIIGSLNGKNTAAFARKVEDGWKLAPFFGFRMSFINSPNIPTDYTIEKTTFSGVDDILIEIIDFHDKVDSVTDSSGAPLKMVLSNTSDNQKTLDTYYMFVDSLDDLELIINGETVRLSDVETN